MHDKKEEEECEKEASRGYVQHSKSFEGEAADIPYYRDEFPIVNIKVLKLIFNRLYRLKSTAPKDCITQLETLLKAVGMVLGKENTLFAVKVLFELTRAHV